MIYRTFVEDRQIETISKKEEILRLVRMKHQHL